MSTRRPIQPGEAPHLRRFGLLLRAIRHDEGLTQQAVADRAQLAASYLSQLENGERRPRRTTLERLTIHGLHRPDALAGLTEAVGPALAPETAFPERVARRHARRWRDRAVAS